MQFKEVGKRIQVLAYRGYDKEKKRAVVKLLGSFNKYSYEMSDGLEESLTDAEKEEVQSYIKKIQQSFNEDMLRSLPFLICSQIEHLSNSLNTKETDISNTQADAIWTRMELMAKALRKAGHKKPAKPVKKPVDAAQGDLLG